MAMVTIFPEHFSCAILVSLYAKLVSSISAVPKIFCIEISAFFGWFITVSRFCSVGKLSAAAGLNEEL